MVTSRDGMGRTCPLHRVGTHGVCVWGGEQGSDRDWRMIYSIILVCLNQAKNVYEICSKLDRMIFAEIIIYS